MFGGVEKGCMIASSKYISVIGVLCAVILCWNFFIFASPHGRLIVFGNLFNTNNNDNEHTDDGPVCYGIEFTGRLGNIMFEYATAAGVCAWHGENPNECVYITNRDANSLEIPSRAFLRSFPNILKRMDSSHCKLNGKSYRERIGDFDEAVFLQPRDTTLLGYFQSYKYFHPHADAFLQEAFRFPEETSIEAENFFRMIQRQSVEVTTSRGVSPIPVNQTVCMAIRRGDKVGPTAASMYDKWALSEDYYLKAVQTFLQKHGRINLITFTGGSFDSEKGRADREWTNQKIVERLNSQFPKSVVAFNDDAIAKEPALVTLSVLTMCPNIIVASSSFSWWGAYLANHSNVVAPKYLHAGVQFLPEDYYPPSWTLLEKSKFRYGE